MKGIINLKIEVDLNKVICDDSIEALKLFTGASNKEEVGVFYLEKLANKITSLGDFRLPHVEHEIYGDIQATVEDIEKYSMSDVVVEDKSEQAPVEPLIEEPTKFDESVIDKQNSLIDKVISSMEDVSINKGLPKSIAISAEVYDSLCVNEKGDGMTRIAGLPVLRDNELEAVMAIAYEPYDGGEIENHYVQTLGNLI